MEVRWLFITTAPDVDTLGNDYPSLGIARFPVSAYHDDTKME